jgi:hypothetical protein
VQVRYASPAASNKQATPKITPNEAVFVCIRILVLCRATSKAVKLRWTHGQSSVRSIVSTVDRPLRPRGLLAGPALIQISPNEEQCRDEAERPLSLLPPNPWDRLYPMTPWGHEDPFPPAQG